MNGSGNTTGFSANAFGFGGAQSQTQPAGNTVAPFGSSSQPGSGFNFGGAQSQPQPTSDAVAPFGGAQSGNNPFNFTFNGQAGNSTPAAPSTPSNGFTFGMPMQNQPSNTTAPASNFFGASAPPVNNASAGFGFGQSQTNASTVPPSNGIFATNNGTGSNIFGASAGFGQNTSAQTAVASSNNVFGGNIGGFGQNTAAPTTATPGNNIFGGFGQNNSSSVSATPQATTASFGASVASNTMFGNTTLGQSSVQPGSTTSETNNSVAAAPTASHNLFGNLGQNKSPAPQTPKAPASNPFSFLSQAQNSAPAASTSTGGDSSSTATPQTTKTPAGNPFSFLSQPQNSTPAANTTTDSSGGFGSTATPQSNMFGAAPAAQIAPTTTTALESTTNFFGGSTTPTGSPSSKFGGFGSPAKDKDGASSMAQGTDMFKSTSTPFGGIFGGLGSTSQTPSKASDSAAPTSSVFGTISSNPTSKPSTTNFFGAPQATSTPFAPKAAEAQATSTTPFSNVFKRNPQPEVSQPEAVKETSSFFSPQKNSAPLLSSGPKNTLSSAPLLKPTEQPKSNPFARLSRSPSPSREQVSQVSNTPTGPSKMPTLTGATPRTAEAVGSSQVPNIPKAHIPSDWHKSSAMDKIFTANDAVPHTQLRDLAAQLATLNQKFRDKILNLSPMVDWTSLSKWHVEQSQVLMKKIADVRKAHAQSKGITGYGSALSTKRKSDEETGPSDSIATPSKKQRGGDVPPQSNMFSQTPKSSETPKSNQPVKDASQTSTVFGSILGKSTSNTSTPSTTKQSAIGQDDVSYPNLTSPASFIPKPVTEPKAKEPPSSKVATSQPAFQIPSFTGSSGSTNFMNQFSKSAKTAAQLREERKKKAAAEDYDSDDESYQSWSDRYDAEEAEKEAAKSAKIQGASTSGFALPVATTASASTKSPFSFAKPTAGPSTASFGSRIGSPTPSASGQSVFDTPSAAPSPASNIFGHLSSGPSSNHQDDFDDDEQEGGAQDGPAQVHESTEQAQSDHATSKRKLDESDSEGEETLEEHLRRRKTDTGVDESTPKVNFWDSSRMTKGPSTNVDSNEADSTIAPKASDVVETPKAPFQFSFAGAKTQNAQTAPRPSAADKTYKIGSPIKFGSQTEAKQSNSSSIFNFSQPSTSTPESGAKKSFGTSFFNTQPATPTPTFSFQPSTPTPADGSIKSSMFAPSTSASSSIKVGLGASSSGPSSALTSRAPTPLSDVGTDPGSSADVESDETSGAPQTDLATLTEEEKDEYDVLYSQENVLVKHQVRNGDAKDWAILARGRLWILKNKETGKTLVRMRIPSGKTPLNYNVLPRVPTTVHGKSLNQVKALRSENGMLAPLYFIIKQPEGVSESPAVEFSRVYNENLPAA
jgi:hypothetical protein